MNGLRESACIQCPKNSVLTVHYGVEEITVNARKMFKKLYWTFADLAVFESGT
jgi:hypothetical protein